MTSYKERLISINDIFGLIRPDIDAHTLGVSMVGELLENSGYKVIYGNAKICNTVANISKLNNISYLISWIKKNKITFLGFSYRLDPIDAKNKFGKLLHLLNENNMFFHSGGTIKEIFFAGLPEACKIIKNEFKNISVFHGDETPLETLKKLGIPDNKIPNKILNGTKYDNERLSFSKELIYKGEYNFIQPPKKPTYNNYGSKKDHLSLRIKHNKILTDFPLTRAHVGPYNSNYTEAKKTFKIWLETLSQTKFLDIVSIGTSQLSQSDFGLDWGDKPNGGGVPINSAKDLIEIWDASRPMLIRTYAGTKNIPQLAEIYEKTINIAWHALSFWWFNKIDGRGPYSVKENLTEHLETLNYIAKTNKPFEPNIPHHFAFRGADDYSYVLSAYLAAKTAKKRGVKYFVLQIMLNTPKYTWGIQDLAKARALLLLVRELEDSKFQIFLQPRAGLSYFSSDLNVAKIQLSMATAMMDDIEPNNPKSPDIIHIVSYCEAMKLATPDYINESIQITMHTLKKYRRLKKDGLIDDMKNNKDVIARTKNLYSEVKKITVLIEKNIKDPYSSEGLYEIFKRGILPTPYLWECKDEFKNAIKWKTSFIDGGIKVINKNKQPISPTNRINEIFLNK